MRRDIYTRSCFDTLKAWRHVHFEYKRASCSAEKVNTGDVYPNASSCSYRGLLLDRVENYRESFPSLMKICSELTCCCLAAHRCNYSPVHN
jgi:hypothetical protein